MSPAAQRRTEARQRAGLTLTQLARKLGRCPRYLRSLELHGSVPEHLADAWARHLNCRKELFL